MHLQAGDAVVNQVELLAFLTAPGVLTIHQGSDVSTYSAPAGLVSFVSFHLFNFIYKYFF